MLSTGIREFTIPLMIGVLAGTYSSIFICSPLLYELIERRSRRRLAAPVANKNKKMKNNPSKDKNLLKTENTGSDADVSPDGKANIDNSAKILENNVVTHDKNKPKKSNKKKNKTSRPNISNKKKKKRRK